MKSTKGTPQEFKDEVEDRLAQLAGLDAAIADSDTLNEITASVKWSSYNTPEFDAINNAYLPSSGEGDNKATQIVTAVNKLIYKWYNDGDVYDNQYGLAGWANDLSTYANWLYKYADCASILERIYDIGGDEGAYEDLLKDLADSLFDPSYLAKQATKAKVDSIYTCDGPFEFVEYEDDEYDDEYDDYDDDDDDWDE